MTWRRRLALSSALGASWGAVAAIVLGESYWWLGAIPALGFGAMLSHLARDPEDMG